MNFVEQPNLPERPVTVLLIDERLNNEAVSRLENLGVFSIPVGMHSELHEPVAGHPDMSFCHIGGRDLVYAPGVDRNMLSDLINMGFNTIEGKTGLKPGYPADIAYNVAIVGQFAFHNFRYTDVVLRSMLMEKRIKEINIRQGYAKCSVCVAGSNSIITTDPGIAGAAKKVGMDVLYISPQRSIRLPGFDYGFIGGSTGLMDKKILAFTGNIEHLSKSNEIKNHLKRNGMSYMCLSDEAVIDTGSMLPVMCL